MRPGGRARKRERPGNNSIAGFTNIHIIRFIENSLTTEFAAEFSGARRPDSRKTVEGIFMRSISNLKTAIAAAALLSAAACIRFQPKPVTAAAILDDFEARRLDAPELRDFLRANRDNRDWPPSAWDLKAMTLAAFYYHPDLDIARAQWGIAETGRITARERPNPSMNPAIGYNATSPIDEVTPWIPEIALEIPLEVAGKRGFRIASARHTAEAARWNILSAAWEVRNRLRAALLELYAAERAETIIVSQQILQTDIVKILEAQREAGEISAYEVTQARVALDNSRLAVLEAARTSEESRAKLAAGLGLPRPALDGIRISFDVFERPLAEIPAGDVRRQALINRSDILALLSEYEAAQNALRLEIAKQYPDIRIGPNYQLDQTDGKWMIGLALDLPIFSRNKGPIAEAEARRTETAARFRALQSRVLGELDAAVADYRAALLKSKAADELLAEQETAAQARFAAGEIAKLDLLGIRLELSVSAIIRLEALVKTQEAAGRLENAAQSPLEIGDWLFTKTPPGTGTVKERKND